MWYMPKVLESFNKSFGEIFKDNAAIEVSTKCHVDVVLIVDSLLKLGVHASISSIKNKSSAIFKYESNVFLSNENELEIISLYIFWNWLDMFLA